MNYHKHDELIKEIIKRQPASSERSRCSSRILMKITMMSIFLWIPGLTARAQAETTPSNFLDDPINHPLMPLLVVTALVAITIVLVLVVAVYMVQVLNMMVQQLERENAEKRGLVYVPEPSWWQKMWQDLNALVPMEKEKDLDLGHSYDGIRELDNHLPPWWKWLFYSTIVWAVGYLIVYHISSSMPLSIGEYENELTLAEQQVRAYKASQPQETIDENTLVFMKDETIISRGKTVFMSNNCGSCHRNDGGGSAIGPNLTDEYWIHGGAMKNIFSTIKTGFVEKGMPAWGKVMSPTDVRNVAFYVMSLQGSSPPNPKAPQGDLFKPVKQDSTQVQALLKKQ